MHPVEALVENVKGLPVCYISNISVGDYGRTQQRLGAFAAFACAVPYSLEGLENHAFGFMGPITSTISRHMPCHQQQGLPASALGQSLMRLSSASKGHPRHFKQQSRSKAMAGKEPGPLDALKSAVSCRIK